MTVHYRLTLTKSDTVFKVTYRSGKFKRIEKTKGELTDKQLVHLGRVIPPVESQIQTFNETFHDSITIEPFEAKKGGKTLYSEFISAWFLFYEKFTGIEYSFSGIDGKAVHQIIAKLMKLCGDESEALQVWNILLDSWKNLDKFHHQHTDLKYINSQLNNLLVAIKKSTADNGTVFNRAMESQTGKDFKF